MIVLETGTGNTPVRGLEIETGGGGGPTTRAATAGAAHAQGPTRGAGTAPGLVTGTNVATPKTGAEATGAPLVPDHQPMTGTGPVPGPGGVAGVTEGLHAMTGMRGGGGQGPDLRRSGGRMRRCPALHHQTTTAGRGLGPGRQTMWPVTGSPARERMETGRSHAPGHPTLGVRTDVWSHTYNYILDHTYIQLQYTYGHISVFMMHPTLK